MTEIYHSSSEGVYKDAKALLEKLSN